MPAATALSIHPTDDQQLLLGLTYGLALTRDGGASWSWMCEGQIEGGGGNVDPTFVMTGDGTLVVLSLTDQGVIVSRDDGCSFERPMGPLEGNRGVDLTLDPSQPGRVLALMSTFIGLDAGSPRYHNFVAHSLDHGRTWEVLAELPEDILPETLEVAPSDANRIYVTGTASSDALEGIVERSDDGGRSWMRTTVDLPFGSGSLFISGIHPKDPDRLWVRVPGQGDLFGVLPARLWLSTDAGASFEQVADTNGGMLGFALSPDGDRIAFGGPSDGLFTAPSDASADPSKVSDMPVSCLRWRASGLYACALEPQTPFSLGFAAEPTQDFVPLWQRANSCRPTCAPPSPLEMMCREPWEQIAPLVGAETARCGEGPTAPEVSIDAGSDDAAPVRDAEIGTVDASSMAADPTDPTAAPTGCACATYTHGSRPPTWLTALLVINVWTRRKLRIKRAAQAPRPS